MKRLICALMLVTAPLCAGISPKAAFNTKKQILTQDVKTYSYNGEFLHVAVYPGGGQVVTCLSGDKTGYQYIEENGVVVDESLDVKWHHHSFTHYYPGGRVRTFTIPYKGQKCQVIKYRKKAKN